MEAQETMTMDIDQFRYPIGPFEFGKTYTDEDLQSFIKKIEELPVQVKKLISALAKDQLDTPYRENGWTVRQIVHHLVDSHVNAYTRFRLALTEESPSIKPYDEKAWAELADAKTADPAVSIALLTHLHQRWVILLKSMSPEDFDRTFYHPEHQAYLDLKGLLAQYAWHGDHHTAHIQLVKPAKKTLFKKAAKDSPAKKSVKKPSSNKSVEPPAKASSKR